MTDYQVIIIGVNDPMIREWIETRELVQTDSGEITNAESLASQIGLIKSIKDYDLKRMISFHGRVKSAENFSSEIQSAINIIPEKHRPKGSMWTNYVSGKMTAYERRLKLGQLKELSGVDRGLLSNAKCLSEGVDVPSLDGVAFIDPKSSPIDIVQAVGRAIRLSKDKKIGTIVLPVFIKEGENVEASIESSNFKPIWNVLNALKSHDDVLSLELDQLRTDLGKGPLGDRTKGISKIYMDLPKSIDSEFANSLKTYLVEKTTSSWNFWFGLLENYLEREGNARVRNAHKEDSYLLGTWVSTQRQKKNNQDLPEHQRNKRWAILSKEQIERLDKLKGWKWNKSEDDWEEAFSYLEKYIAREGHVKVPRKHKEDSCSLGSWVSSQRVRKKNTDLPEKQRTKTSTLSKEQIERLESLKGWVWDPLEDLWAKSFSCLEKYIAREGNARVPRKHKEDSCSLGSWVGSQRIRKRNTDLPEKQRTKTSILSKEQIERLESLKGWAWNARK